MKEMCILSLHWLPIIIIFLFSVIFIFCVHFLYAFAIIFTGILLNIVLRITWQSVTLSLSLFSMHPVISTFLMTRNSRNLKGKAVKLTNVCSAQHIERHGEVKENMHKYIFKWKSDGYILWDRVRIKIACEWKMIGHGGYWSVSPMTHHTHTFHGGL